MGFPLIYLLYFYGAIMVGYALFAIFNIYHLFSYGFTSGWAVMVIIIFVSGLVLLAYFSLQYFNLVDWAQAISAPDLGLGLSA